MAVLRWVCKILALTGLALSMLVMSSAPAEAAVSSISCAEGELVGDQCIITGDEPVAGEPTCPTSATVLQDGPECYTLVAPIATCDEPATLSGIECVQVTNPDPGETACPDGYLDDGSGFSEEFGDQILLCLGADPTCPEGTEFDDFLLECLGPIDLELGCTGNARFSEVACLEPVDGECPEPGIYVGGGTCEAFAGATCPDGLFFDGVFCAGPATCPAGATTDIFENCVIVTEPVGGPPVCPDGSFFEAFVDTCVEPTDTICPPGGFDLGGLFCEALAIEEQVCPAGYELDGFFCFADGTCPEGSMVDDALVECVFYREPVSGSTECVGEAEWVPEELACYDFVEAICPAGAVAVAGFCEVEPTAFDDCPNGYQPGSFGLCTADAICPAGSQFLDTEFGAGCFIVSQRELTCPAFEDPETGACIDLVNAECPEPGVYLGNGVCEAEPIQTPPSCPATATDVVDEFGELVGCEITEEATLTCAPQAPLGPDGCRRQVDLLPGALICADGFGLVDGECIRSLPPIYLCDGQEVTINMVTGDSGVGTPGDDVILGTNSGDFIIGHGGDDVICAGRGNDVVFAGAGRDLVFGELGNDRIVGGAGNDDIYGGFGRDRLLGSSGSDLLVGGIGNDQLFGQRGADLLFGNSGFDRCDGGFGFDISDGTCERRRSVSNNVGP